MMIVGMSAITTPHPPMPDVAHHARSPFTGTLDKVGMTAIEVPVRLRGEDGAMVLAPAKADAFVSLDDPQAKGIHMSRLYLTLHAILEEDDFSLAAMRRILQAFVSSHSGLSRSASLELAFELPLRRRALRSANSAWRIYPVTASGVLCEGVYRFRLGLTVAYSSTCPCSAALARQLVQERFRGDFAGRASVPVDELSEWLGRESSIVATPHAQRSYAVVEVEVDDQDAPSFTELIDLVENCLQTAVQAAVKREDEQEFARLNGANLMFCEDAGRRLKHALEAHVRIRDYRIEAVHVESLHPHNAVSVVTKGVAGGFVA